ncbi:MAG: hypothetical protein KJ574_01000 [Nanoarchaeota archaeon]|nr:hypothetical protein [Nanoarchaeota archaeon]
MDSAQIYQYAKYIHASRIGWPTKKACQKSLRMTVFAFIIAAFWLAFFKLFLADFNTETYTLACISTAVMSFFGNGWGVFEKILR